MEIMVENESYETSYTSDSSLDDADIIPKDKIILIKQIGQGNFGKVYKGNIVLFIYLAIKYLFIKKITKAKIKNYCLGASIKIKLLIL